MKLFSDERKDLSRVVSLEPEVFDIHSRNFNLPDQSSLSESKEDVRGIEGSWFREEQWRGIRRRRVVYLGREERTFNVYPPFLLLVSKMFWSLDSNISIQDLHSRGTMRKNGRKEIGQWEDVSRTRWWSSYSLRTYSISLLLSFRLFSLLSSITLMRNKHERVKESKTVWGENSMSWL